VESYITFTYTACQQSTWYSVTRTRFW